MKQVWNWIWNSEPAIALQVPTVVLGAATVYFDNVYLAFASAAFAALGALATRANVKPTETPFGD